jgi:hypothetical protein
MYYYWNVARTGNKIVSPFSSLFEIFFLYWLNLPSSVFYPFAAFLYYVSIRIHYYFVVALA